MVDASLVQQVLPRRLAAKHASASITQQLDDSDSDAAHTQNSSPSPNRVTIKYGRKAKAMRKRMGHESEVKRSALNSQAPDTATSSDLNGATTPLRGRARATKKRPFVQDSNSAGEAPGSPLTPVSDANTFSSTLSPPPTSPTPPSLTPRPFPVIVQTNNGFNSSNHRAGGKRKRREPSGPKRWKKKDLGDFVWVLIDDQSRIYDHDKTATEGEHVWWPGRIRPPPGGGRRIFVNLYGQAPFKVKNIEVNHPTEDNILPFNDSAGEARFNAPTYVTPSKDDGSDVMTSPRKKAKRDRHELGERWNSAVLELNAERDEGNAIPGGIRPGQAPDSTVHSAASEDDLPEVGEMDWKASLASIPGSSQGNASPAKENESLQKRKGRRKGKQKAAPISEGESDFGIRRLEEDALCLSGQDDLFAHHIDETLQIPGELILAKGTNGDKSYWPARILEYVPQKSKKEREGKYKIEYLDGFTSVVDRNAFYTSEEDGFGTCKLGKFESSYDDTVNDSETEGVVEPPSQTRYPSPILANPPPSKEAFFELDMPSQFVYTKPILVAILNEQYAPARERHDLFLKGGQARKSIVDSAMLRGEIVPESVGELQRRLCDWCLREEMLGQEDRKKQVTEKVEELQVDGAETSHEQLETTQSNVVTEDTIESEEATGSPSVITSTTLPPEGPPDPSSVDVTMEDVIDKASPLSTLSSLTNEAAPTPSENKEVKMLETPGDATESMSDLTELEDPAPSASKSDAPVSETLPGLPRQHGCPAYEALTSMEKLEYCLNVLLPEAILQILLWRKGLRTATEILSQDEEERLHAEGAKLLHVTDWVYDVVRLRRLHERKFVKQKGKDGISSSQKSDRGGGRLRRVGRVNYHE